MDDVLEKVKEFADQAHGNQRRKYTPDRYIVHPIRVMHTCREYTGALPMLASALLHDVLEDTPVTEGDIHAFLVAVMSPEDAQQTTRLVVELTDVYTKEAFPNWNRKKRKQKEVARMSAISADAQTVKYADILDNCNEIVEHDPQFAPRFLNECKMLLNSMSLGNQELYKRSKDAVNAGLARLAKRA
jgi:(p)ppGpp synthase/HD superfamily hydrolase